ncbi:putative zinc finger protein [Orchesella cincta]|uniref:Putative zinc finger protein n=1 Tax=Orchesella cincta TaxID=48709 RepID=A0A1D2M2G6_ORCCI|nr:putative zinc finger protein [Orchesella cincta]
MCKEFQKTRLLFHENLRAQWTFHPKNLSNLFKNVYVSHFADRMNHHTCEKPFTCPTCEKPFASKNGVRQHLTSHSNIRIHSCSKCEKSFKNSSSLNYHNKRVHSGSDYLKHKCSQPSCGKVFYNPESIAKAHVDHKAPLERPHRFCHLCNSTRAFLTDHGFRRHLGIHHSATPANQCNFCRKLFESREKLLEHVRESGHNKEKEFSCVICRQHFSLRKVSSETFENEFAHCERVSVQNYVEQLQKHVDSAHNSAAKERTFFCKVEGCSKACLTQKNLSLHIDEVHKQVRKAKCGKCGQMFRRGSHLTAHLKTSGLAQKPEEKFNLEEKLFGRQSGSKTEKCKSYPSSEQRQCLLKRLGFPRGSKARERRFD